MRFYQRFVLRSAFAVIMALVACGEGRAEPVEPAALMADTPETAVEQQTPRQFKRVASWLGPLDVACRAATGEGLRPDGICLCPDRRDQFFVDQTTHRGVCQRALVNGSSCTHGQQAAADKAVADTCLANLAEFGADYPDCGTQLMVHVPSDPHEKDLLSQWVQQLTDGSTPPRLWKPFQLGNELHVHVGQSVRLITLHDALFGALEMMTFKSSVGRTFYNTIVEPDVSRLSQILGMRELSVDERLTLFASAPDKAFWDQQTQDHLHAAYHAFATSDFAIAFARGSVLAGGDCTGGCTLQSEPLELGPNARVTLQRTYASGTVARETLKYEQNGTLRAIILLGPNRVPGLTAVLAPVVSSSRVGGDLLLYDRMWNPIGHHAFTVPDKFERLDNVIRAPVQVSRQAPAMALCEGDLREVVADPNLSPSLGFGPSLPSFRGETLTSGSIFGWFHNQNASVEDYLKGWVLRYAGFIPHHAIQDEEIASHGREVMRSALQMTPALQILPIGNALSCFARYDDWSANMRGLSRVVSMSFAEPMERLPCTTQVMPTLRRTASDVLWVAAAGNFGEAVSRPDAPSTLCPSGLSGQVNLLVVAGAVDGRLHPQSIFGKEYADLAADWYAPDSPHGGTSFAAPRVAAVAAELLHAWPKLTPAAARLILIASSRVTQSLHDVVRSGGLLDADAAKRLAPCVEEASPFKRAALVPGMLHACMVESGFSYEFADEKIEMLIDRHAFDWGENT